MMDNFFVILFLFFKALKDSYLWRAGLGGRRRRRRMSGLRRRVRRSEGTVAHNCAVSLLLLL